MSASRRRNPLREMLSQLTRAPATAARLAGGDALGGLGRGAAFPSTAALALEDARETILLEPLCCLLAPLMSNALVPEDALAPPSEAAAGFWFALFDRDADGAIGSADLFHWLRCGATRPHSTRSTHSPQCTQRQPPPRLPRPARLKLLANPLLRLPRRHHMQTGSCDPSSRI